MKKIYLTLVFVMAALAAGAQGWPANYGGVMLQGFYWDSFRDTKWTTLESQAKEMGQYFDLVWIPQSGLCSGKSMGYNPKYYWNQNSSFGTEAELRALIKAFKDNGIGTIADVVVNHRDNMSNWVDFPAETYNGVTYQMLSTDICADDDGGEAKKWADANGYKLSPNKDSGEGWGGMRDLDHASENVQTIVKAYEKYLLDDLGYAGFRYDVAKGFAAKYFGMYNAYAKPQFSVGEYWDGNVSSVKSWVDGTKVDGVIQSAVFDFPCRYAIRDAIQYRRWSELNRSGRLISDKNYTRYAVTFAENHDTEFRSSSSPQDPIKSDTLLANAYILAMPGTPCVFLKHWQAYKKEIKLMIEARKLVGVHSQSNAVNYASHADYIAFNVTGTKGSLLVVLGSKPQSYTRAGYTELLSGPGYRYLVKDVDTSGWAAIVKRVEEESVEEPEDPFTDRDVTIHVSTELPAGYSASTVNYWVWSYTDNSNLCSNKNWPGDRVTATKSVGGKTWIYKTYRVTAKNNPINIVISGGTGSPQTVDVENISTDKYFVISASKDSGNKNFVEDVTEQYATGIGNVTADTPAAGRIYNLNGQYVGADADALAPGVYILNGKKYIVR